MLPVIEEDEQMNEWFRLMSNAIDSLTLDKVHFVFITHAFV